VSEVKLNVAVSPELRKAVKVRAAELGESIQALVVRVLEREVRRG
jgi:predicted HicB family RNase H-like nuclease